MSLNKNLLFIAFLICVPQPLNSCVMEAQLQAHQRTLQRELISREYMLAWLWGRLIQPLRGLTKPPYTAYDFAKLCADGRMHTAAATMFIQSMAQLPANEGTFALLIDVVITSHLQAKRATFGDIVLPPSLQATIWWTEALLTKLYADPNFIEHPLCQQLQTLLNFLLDFDTAEHCCYSDWVIKLFKRLRHTKRVIEFVQKALTKKQLTSMADKKEKPYFPTCPACKQVVLLQAIHCPSSTTNQGCTAHFHLLCFGHQLWLCGRENECQICQTPLSAHRKAILL